MFFVAGYKNEVVLSGYLPRSAAGFDVLDKLKTLGEYTICVFGSIEEYLEFVRSKIAQGV